MKLRYVEEKVVFGLCLFAATMTALFLVLIVGKIALEGLPALTPYFFFTPESDTVGLGQGIANAVVGTLLISFFATLIATPLAIGTAIYLQKYASDNRATQSFRFLIEVLSGTPSIVLGIFGLFLFVYYMRVFTGGFSLIAGSIALAILIIPVIERAAEDAIISIPSGLEEGSYALGATKWQTIRRIVIPSSLSGIFTGVILGFGRAAEESAVVVLTAGYSQFMPELGMRANENLLFGTKFYPFQDLVGTLPIFVYHGYQNSAMIPVANAFAAAFVLILIVLLINCTAKLVLWRYRLDRQ
jgi:phosphate transport system permease protein